MRPKWRAFLALAPVQTYYDAAADLAVTGLIAREKGGQCSLAIRLRSPSPFSPSGLLDTGCGSSPGSCVAGHLGRPRDANSDAASG